MVTKRIISSHIFLPLFSPFFDIQLFWPPILFVVCYPSRNISLSDSLNPSIRHSRGLNNQFTYVFDCHIFFFYIHRFGPSSWVFRGRNKKKRSVGSMKSLKFQCFLSPPNSSSVRCHFFPSTSPHSLLIVIIDFIQLQIYLKSNWDFEEI